MKNPTKAKRSQEEVIEAAARLVAGTINPEAMKLNPEEVDVEEFIKLFIKKTEEILQEKERITLAVGPYLNLKGATFTDDLLDIIQFIEGKTGRKFYFYNGILIYLGKNDIVAAWMPDRPL